MRGDGSFAIGSDVWPGVSKLIEEMGELAQVLGKLLGTSGSTDHWDGTDLLERLYNELADVQAALWFVMIANDLNPDRIAIRSASKLRKFTEWHESQHG